MKKLLFSLAGLMLCGFMAQAQLNGNITGTLVDANQQPLPGVAVFFYGHSTQLGGTSNLSVDPNDYKQMTYTDANGDYTMGNYWSFHADTVVVGVLDCQRNVVLGTDAVFTSSPNATVNLQVTCAPLACDVVFETYSYTTGSGPVQIISAVSLRDSTYANINSPITHTWTYNGITRTGMANLGPNQDSVMIFAPTMPNVCYQRLASCAPQCLNGPVTPSLNCQAAFYVDTVNSINFQGQVVIWENSTTSAGNIIGHRWDFGDGNTSNVQYPTHTYNDTGVYNVCLTIVSVDGTDTCSSTFCDSIGFDAQGNLVYKTTQQGFTINVIDPATVGQLENNLASNFNLYPNPSNGEAVLNWDAGIGVKRIDVVAISGKVVRSVEPQDPSAQFQGLATGIYILRIESEQGVAALKMMVH